MTQDPNQYLEQPFGHLHDLLAMHAAQRPEQMAFDDGAERLNWGEAVSLIHQIAAQLQADGLKKGQAVSILGTTSVRYALVYIASIVAGGCAAPLTTSATPKQLTAMMKDSGAQHLFIDSAKRAELMASGIALPQLSHIMLDKAAKDAPALYDWMAPAAHYKAPDIGPDDPYNIIYSSGTTGTPKGIVHSRLMRWRQAQTGGGYGMAGQVTLLSTPLYSNTTLGLFTPTIAYGGSTVLMGKFDVARWCTLCEAHRATHTMLVPVQYQRLMDFDGFEGFDTSSLQLKYCTSAPFSAELKREVLRRMHGGLVEIYSMTEGGVVCVLLAHEHPDKLHSVGQPWGGSEVITIDEAGARLSNGAMGELVGRSPTMMSGYQNQPDKTKEASWYDEHGQRWQRMGDIGRVDADGFVILMGRSKDMIISGGFNIYPRDLEEALMAHDDVADAAVIGVPSRQWGETPVGFVVAEHGRALDCEDVLASTNAQLGKTQRLSALHQIAALPRSHIGKILKTELRAMVISDDK
jgi:acyl-CoA synthetase (AMP-forming)/AMP-acid ligase II